MRKILRIGASLFSLSHVSCPTLMSPHGVTQRIYGVQMQNSCSSGLVYIADSTPQSFPSRCCLFICSDDWCRSLAINVAHLSRRRPGAIIYFDLLPSPPKRGGMESEGPRAFRTVMVSVLSLMRLAIPQWMPRTNRILADEHRTLGKVEVPRGLKSHKESQGCVRCHQTRPSKKSFPFLSPNRTFAPSLLGDIPERYHVWSGQREQWKYAGKEITHRNTDGRTFDGRSMVPHHFLVPWPGLHLILLSDFCPDSMAATREIGAQVREEDATSCNCPWPLGSIMDLMSATPCTDGCDSGRETKNAATWCR